MADGTVEISDIASVLSSLNCPLIVRTDEWWMEELLFKPGKPRMDLLTWVISKVANSSGASQDLDSTNVSTMSNSYKLPETNEGILELLITAGVCTEQSMPFVKGALPAKEQMKYWRLLMKPLQYLERSNLNTGLSFGCSSITNILSMDNFLDAFCLKASLLPADVQSEIEQVSKTKCRKVSENETRVGRNLQYDEMFVQTFSEQVNRLKTASEQFTSLYKSDLKICLPKTRSSTNIIELGGELQTINSKCTDWKLNAGALLEFQRRNTLDINRQKTESLLERSLKDKALPPFRNLCNYE